MRIVAEPRLIWRFWHVFPPKISFPRATITSIVVSAVLVGKVHVAQAQYKTGTALFEEKIEAAEADLTATLKGGNYVENEFYPNRQVIVITCYSLKRVFCTGPVVI